MNKEKLKEPYERAGLEIILFEFSDIITTSDAGSGGSGVNPPDEGNVGSGGWIEP